MITQNTDIRGRAVGIADLAEYQEGAIVSRTLLKGGSGSVTLFAFDKNQELSEHTVPHDALVHVIDGRAEITISGNRHRLGRGEVLVMPANEPHQVRAEERFKMLLTMIRS